MSLETTDRLARREPGATRQLAGLGLLAVAIMAPVTMPVPVLRELVQDRFLVSEFLTSLFMSVNMLGGFLTAPLAGVVADRLGRRRRLLIGALLVDAACFVALTLPVSFTTFLALRFLEGCAHITALSVLLMLASNTFPSERRGRAMGLVGGCMMLGIAIGAPLGGWLGRESAILPLQTGAAMLGAAAVMAGLVVREVAGRSERPSFGAIGRALRDNPIILAPLAFAFTDRFTVGFFTTTFALYLRRIHDLSPPQIGAMIAAFMLPFALFSYPFGRIADKRSPVMMLAVGSLLYGFGTVLVGFTGPPALYWLMLATGVAAAVMFVPSMLMTVQVVPEQARATALGAFNAAGSLGFILGPIAGGGISQFVAERSDWALGYRAAFIASGLSEALCVAIALPLLWRFGRRATGRGMA